MSTDRNITFYSDNATRLAAQYDNVAVTNFHDDWLAHLPEPGMALDVGAGSGRDARFLASKGFSVVAVEPANGIREVAQAYSGADTECTEIQYSNTQHTQTQGSIHWLDDCLPELKQVFALQVKFDLILLSAVWMHIPASQRERALRKLSSLLKPSGKLIITLRHGACHDARVMHDVSADELAQLARQFGLSYRLLTPEAQSDRLGRDDVTWQTVMLSLPDDGTGAFPLIRNIVVNDVKSSTYKVALLRTLLRIADGHPGAVIEQNSEYVTLPMGLVALYWLKLYKPLLDTFTMNQSTASRGGLGFVKPKGWGCLSQLSANDFYIGALYTDVTLAVQINQTLKDIITTIKNMPVKYTKAPNSQDTVFYVERRKVITPKSAIVLDMPYLSSFGTFHVPRHIWDSLTRFSIWIEPALVNEWVGLMSRYSQNQAQGYTNLDYLSALHWDNPKRSTQRVRQRVDKLAASTQLQCCWSGYRLKRHDYAIDHAFPFARWPNNDLWNLLPTTTSVNANKSDKLPTSQKLIASRELITQWWQTGWAEHEAEFFTQANFALPNLGHDNRSFADVFEALSLQRDRIKDFQQLADWG